MFTARMRPVIAALLASFALTGIVATTQAESPAPATATTSTPVTQVTPAPDPCAHVWTSRGAYRKVAHRAYSHKRTPQRSLKRMKKMRGCMKPARQKWAIHLDTHLRHVRAFKARIARMGNRGIGLILAAKHGWTQRNGQFGCLDALWNKESHWRTWAHNPSGAHGIPQALPGSKMASAGRDWATNAWTQIKWGLSYIRSVYRTPCNAWAHSRATNWY